MSSRLRTYVAGPISKGSLLDNVNQASECGVRLMLAGLSPLVPHWSVFAGGCFLDADLEPDWKEDGVAVVAKAQRLPCGTTHSSWMEVDLPWVRVSDAVLRLPGESKGADEEVAEAMRCGVPVFYSESDLLAWAKERG